MNLTQIMRQAFRLSFFAVGNSDPNPPVGAILMAENSNQILGEGFTQRAGGPHAEVMAIMNAEKHYDLAKFSDLVLIVTLEPCSHYGRTPPCAALIITKNIKKVIFAVRDISPMVQNRGESFLNNAGVQTLHTGVRDLEAEYNLTLAPFFYRVRTGLPWLTLKWAETAGGHLAPATGPSGRISSPLGTEAIMRLRDKFKATLASPGSVLYDQAKLTARYDGAQKFSQVTDSALAQFLDSVHLRAQRHAPSWSFYKPPARFFWLPRSWSQTQIMNFIDFQQNLGGYASFFVSSEMNFFSQAAYPQIHTIDRQKPLHAILAKIASLGYDRVMFEAGPTLASAVVNERIAQNLVVLKSARTFSWENAQARKVILANHDLSQAYQIDPDQTIALPDDLLTVFQPPDQERIFHINI